LSKSAENGFGKASRTVFVNGHPSSLPQSVDIVALCGLEVCDGGHRLGVMKEGLLRLTEAELGGTVGTEQLFLEGQAMTIEIKRPEIEALIQQRLHSGAFESVEDVLFDALEIQSEREVWLQENKEAINAKIERGLAQLDRGEGIPGDQLRTRLADDKAAWLRDRSGS
jgi:antitoxin ParD1/3/4